MGQRAVREKALSRAAVAGAVLSTVATFVQMAALLLVTDASTLRVMAVPLLLGGATAVLYGLWFTWRSVRGATSTETNRGRAFNLTSAVIFGHGRHWNSARLRSYQPVVRFCGPNRGDGYCRFRRYTCARYRGRLHGCGRKNQSRASGVADSLRVDDEHDHKGCSGCNVTQQTICLGGNTRPGSGYRCCMDRGCTSMTDPARV